MTGDVSQLERQDIPGHLLERQNTVFLDGVWRRGSPTGGLQAINPSSGAVFAHLAPANLQDVDVAAEAATRAFTEWRAYSGRKRAVFLNGFAAGLRSRKAQLVALQMLNNGKPRFEAEIDIDDAVATFEYYAQLAEALDDRQGLAVDLADPSLGGATYFEPLGPAALIVPWNFPLVTTAWKLAPALAAGCTAVLKPSEFTTLAELVYGDIAIEIALPPGVLNIVPGGGEIGAAMCRNARFRKISFTGSNASGRKVMEAASQRNVPVSLELGGKSPIVILNDANIAQAVDIACAGIFFNCGQICSATSRLIVADEIADDFIEALRAKVASIRVGGCEDQSAEMGPLTTRAQYEKVSQTFDKAKTDRLECLAGGNVLSQQDGYFVKPTLYLETPRTHEIWREEIFGPVLTLTRAKSDDQIVERANDTEFGLAATVVGTDEARVNHIAARIDAGHVWINTPQIIFPNTAWGGFKASGVGRELGPWGMAAYSGVKHVTRLKKSTV